jgi:Skp family chaperone for outer membrane proteins
MINKKKLLLTTVLLLAFLTNNSYATTAFIDFKKVLNTSTAGAEAQKILQKKIESQANKFNKEEKEIRKEETQIISQKKLISGEEYKKKVQLLRARAAKMQKNRQTELSKIAKTRDDAKVQLLKKLNPIISSYMKEKKIRIVLDKKAVLLGDVNLDITSTIIKLLNKDLKSLNIK